MQRIFYDSKQFSFEHVIRQVFKIKNKEDNKAFQDIVDKSFKCHNILIIQKSSFFEIYLEFNVVKEETFQKLTQLVKLIEAKPYYEKYKNFECRNSYKIFPNKTDEEFWIEFFDFTKLNLVRLQGKCVIDIICPLNNVSFFVKGNKANNNLDISLFLDRINLSDIEKKFIIQNHRNEVKGIVLEKAKPKSADLFTDFMNKDDFDGSNFKITEAEREIFNPETVKIVDGFDDPSFELNSLIGLSNVKKELLKLNAKVDYQYDRLSRNIYDANTTNLHMCFFGNPGTGKTTVARIVTSILYNLGYIKRNKCIEINANEFKGGRIGETAIKTKIILRNSINKVLFIDEAYALFDKRDGFGQEAVDTIIKEMEDNRQNMVIIFAGYKKEMQDFINMNEGLKSRISRYIEFENYNTVELCKIFVNMLHKQHLNIETNAFIKLVKIFKEMQLQNNFSNGRFVRNVFEELLEEHAFNVSEGKALQSAISINDITDELIRQLYIQNKNVNY